jgi:YesN/AraC family two-component response regulator
MFIGAVVTFWLVKVHYKGLPKPTKKDELSQTSSPSDEDVEDSALLQRICQLMDEEQLYLRSNLKVQDVAVLLNTNSSYVSEIINSRRNLTFSQFVNTYRIRHAQTLLRQQSDMKTSNVAAESGFSTEASFFRNFKAVTGMTPREWLHKSTQN